MSELPVESVRAVREHLAEVVDRASRDEPTVITRRGREVAAMVPVSLLHQWQEWQEAEILRLVAERRGSATVPLEDVLDETLERDT